MSATLRPEPQALDAEEMVLGALLISPTKAAKVDEVLALLEPEHFYRESHGLIYAACRELRLEGKPTDPLLVVSELEKRLTLKKAGGQKRIVELACLVPAVGTAPHHARLVREAWEKRILARALDASKEAAMNGHSPDEALQLAERSLLDVRDRTERGRSSIWRGIDAAHWYEDKLRNPHEEGRGIAVPFQFLPRLQAGRLYVLAGYTSDGKTVLAVQHLRAACSDRKRVGFVTVEMSRQDLTDRIVSCFGVPYLEAVTGRVAPPHRNLAEHAIAEMARWNWEIIDDESITPEALRRYQRIGRYDLLIIDHLHRFDWTERRDLERVVRTITNLARAFEIPVLLLAQIRRPGDGHFPRPTLSALRETGVIENEAALVSFVWRKRDERQQRLPESELIIAKNRFGVSDRMYPLHFDGARVRFSPVEQAA